jgi:hypothetical protein
MRGSEFTFAYTLIRREDTYRDARLNELIPINFRHPSICRPPTIVAELEPAITSIAPVCFLETPRREVIYKLQQVLVTTSNLAVRPERAQTYRMRHLVLVDEHCDVQRGAVGDATSLCVIDIEGCR